jgi:hypothetical protein
MWDYKDRIMSEVPFLLFTYLAFWLLGRAHDETLSLGRRRWSALSAGVALYLACGTRSVGVILLPCVVAEGWLRRKRPGRVTPLVLTTFAAGVLLQRLLLPGDNTYFDQLALGAGMIGPNLLWLLKAPGLLADNGRSAVGLLLSFAAVGGLGLAGFLSRVRQGITSRELFFVLYPMVLVAWPTGGSTPRFLMPMAPLGLVYVCHGLRLLGSWRGPVWERAPGTVLALGVLAVYAVQFGRADFGSLREGVGKPESVALFDYVRRETPLDAVVLFQKPRAMALLTGRHAAAPHRLHDDAELWRYLEGIGATHVVADRDVFGNSPFVLRPFAERYPDRLRPVFQNRDFTVYAVTDGPSSGLRAGR